MGNPCPTEELTQPPRSPAKAEDQTESHNTPDIGAAMIVGGIIDKLAALLSKRILERLKF